MAVGNGVLTPRTPHTKSKHGTCKQSRDVLTTRGDLDWQASSNGRKYLSASMKFAFGGAAAPSLGKSRKGPRGRMRKKKLASLHLTPCSHRDWKHSVRSARSPSLEQGGYKRSTCNLRRKPPESHVQKARALTCEGARWHGQNLLQPCQAHVSSWACWPPSSKEQALQAPPEQAAPCRGQGSASFSRDSRKASAWPLIICQA